MGDFLLFLFILVCIVFFVMYVASLGEHARHGREMKQYREMVRDNPGIAPQVFDAMAQEKANHRDNIERITSAYGRGLSKRRK